MPDDDPPRRNGTSADIPSTLRSTFTFTRRARPPSKKSLDNEGRVPLASVVPAIQLSRKESKGGLRGMFTRNKVEAGSSVSPVVEDFIPQGRPRSPPRKEIDGKIGPHTQLPFSRPHLSGASSAPEAVPQHNPQSMATGFKSARKTKSTAKINGKTTSKQPLRTPRRTDAAWDPPPLFQAYPQAIKHALLAASTLSADSIIRIGGHKRSGSINQDIAQTGLGVTEEQTAAAKKVEKAKNKHRRQISGSITKAEWTQKIYVLVTSGYLLQYAGEGSFDRLPEKMMQLGKDSVAFASDVIPGKHWVLQISQAMDSDGTPAPDSRSLLSRLTFRGADYRRTATSFLLILESAEDMESWITTVRREIESLGGKKYRSETGKPKIDDKLVGLKSQPSHRFLVARDPDRMSNPASPQTLTLKAPWNQSPDGTYHEPLSPTYSSHSIPVPASNRLSVATSMASERHALDSQKDGNYRLSYMSSGQRTLVTSRGSSPMSSPTSGTFTRDDQDRNDGLKEEVRLRPNATAISERRRSMQTLQDPALEYQSAQKVSRPRPHSTYAGGIPIRTTQHHLEPMPNFSIPHAAIKRLSRDKIIDNSVLSTLNGSSRPSRSPVKSTRKGPPAPLQPRSLSPVKDQPSPRPQPSSDAQAGSSFRTSQASRPDVADITVRPRTSPQRQAAPSERPKRFSTLPTLDSSKSSHTDFTFPPRRLSTPPRESSDTPPASPTRLPPLAPPVMVEPALVPLPPSPTDEHLAKKRLVNGHISSLLYDPPTIPMPQPPTHAQKPRRPASMQVLSNASPRTPKTFPPFNRSMTPSNSRIPLPLGGNLTPVSSQNETSFSKSATKSPTAYTPASSKDLLTPPLSSGGSLLSPSTRKLKSYNNKVKRPLVNRRSMPHLLNGPPPAPPPNCALPPLPSGEEPPQTGSSSSLIVQRVNVRNSVQI